MKNNINGNCAYCGAKLERVYFASNGHKFCPNTDCLAKFQDGVQSYQKPPVLPKTGKLNWRYHDAPA